MAEHGLERTPWQSKLGTGEPPSVHKTQEKNFCGPGRKETVGNVPGRGRVMNLELEPSDSPPSSLGCCGHLEALGMSFRSMVFYSSWLIALFTHLASLTGKNLELIAKR